MPASVVSTSQNAIGSGAVTVTAPTSITNGNLLLAVQIQDNDAGAFTGMTAPSGWALLADSSSVSTAGGYGKIWTKIASGENGNYTFGGSSNATNYVRIFNITGQAPTFSAGTPVWSRPTAAATTTFVAPTMTMATAGIIFRGYNVMGASQTLTPPSGYTGTSTVDPGAYMVDLVAYKANSASGATGTANATGTSSGNTNAQGYLTVTFGVRDGGTNASASPANLAATASFPARTVIGVKRANPSVLAAVAAFYMPFMKMELFRDNFATQDTTKWTGYNTGFAQVLNGQVSIPCDPGYPNLFANRDFNLLSSAGSIQLVQRPNVGNGTTQGWFTLMRDGSNRLDWQVNGNNIVANYVVGGVNTDVLVTPYNSVDYQWLRIRESGGTVFWDSAPDGLTWTNRGSAVVAGLDLTNLHVYLAAGYYGTEPTPGAIVFDNMNFTPGNVNAQPGTLSGTTTFPASTTRAGATALPAVLSGSTAFPGPTLSASRTALPAVVAASAAFPTLGRFSAAVATPTALSGTAIFPAPTVAVARTATPTSLQASTTFPVPVASGGSTASPGVLSGSTSFPSRALSSAAQATPGTLSATATFPTATALAGSGSGATPGVLVGTTSFGATAKAGSSVNAAVLQATTQFPSPAVSAGSSTGAAPATLQGTTSFSGAVRAGSTANPATLQGSASFPTATASAGVSAGATPTVLGATATFPTAVASAASTSKAAPGTLQGTTTFPTPAVSAASSASAAPAVLTGSASFPGPTVRLSTVAAPTALLGVASIPTPAVSAAAGSTALPGTLSGSASFPGPVVKASGTATASTLSATTVFGAAKAAVTARPGTIAVGTTFPSPVVQVTRAATAKPGVLQGMAHFYQPDIMTGDELFPRAKLVFPDLFPTVRLVARRAE